MFDVEMFDGDRIREVEQASFTPLVFATTGGMGKEAMVFYRRLASLLSHHNSTAYSLTLAWMRCTLFFSVALCYSVHSWKPVHLASSCGKLLRRWATWMGTGTIESHYLFF